MNATAAGFEFGSGMVGARLGVDHAEMLRRRAANDVMLSHEAEPFERQLCKIAVELFEAAGDTTSPGVILFRNLEKAAWHSSFSRFTDRVRQALVYMEQEKKASALVPAVAGLHDKLGGGILKTLAAGGALGGVTLGSLAFLMARNAAQTSTETAGIMEKIRTYKKLKKEIEEDMANDIEIAPDTKTKKNVYEV